MGLDDSVIRRGTFLPALLLLRRMMTVICGVVVLQVLMVPVNLGMVMLTVGAGVVAYVVSMIVSVEVVRVWVWTMCLSTLCVLDVRSRRLVVLCLRSVG